MIILLIINLRECLLDLFQTSTLPLNERDIMHHPKLVSEIYKLPHRLMILVFQSWEMSLSYFNEGETPFVDLPLIQLTLSEISLTMGPYVIASSISSLYHSYSKQHD